MNWVLLAYTLFGCLVYAAGVWRITITMKSRKAYTNKWKTLRFPRKENYVGNLDIRWPITASLGQIIMFDMKYMKLQASTDCQADNVQLFNGVDYNSYSNRMDIFCGNVIGAGFYNSTESSTLIRFISNDDVVVGYGFKIRYRAVALPVTTTATTTATTSTTTTTPKTTITITTTIPTSTKLPTTISTTTTKPTTQMTTSSTTTSTTTTAKTTTIFKDTTNAKTTTTNVVVTSPTTLSDPEDEDDSSEETQIESSVLTETSSLLTIPFCFHHYTNQHILTASKQVQVFKSRGYPLSYPSNLQEEWLIVKPKANDSLAIVVADVDTEYSANCGYDRVSIYDRSCPDTAPKRVFCGKITLSVTLKGDQFALVRFSADTTNHGRGIMVKYWLNDKTDLAKDDSVLDDTSLKTIIVGVIVAFGGFCVSLGVIRWVMRCRERRKQKAGNGRRHANEANNSQEPSSRTSRRQGHRQSGNGGNTTVTVLDVSHTGQTRRNGRGGRNSLTEFTGIMVQPPSYNTLFVPGQGQSELILKPPAYDSKSYEPPPYPGSPVPPPPIETSQRTNRLLPSVHGTRGGNRRNQQRTSQHTTRIAVKPVEDNREELRSPPPRYEE
ncbi:topoisomerase I damage affected protein 7-like isoform X2 [Mizuhopecten yessoensis]|uniref:topoisomerase I damage affected protein 7-like isoform X2 n=1 Tax=Mizuhopecten yessoensis TaxID=6573 RepID=UPI000B45A25C|nr:topoisomerase I damage affected protein 7-like isoform X2 [Mizuhopecten yessoensis]